MENHTPVSLGTALRELLVFQLKLGADTLRDLVLSPVSIGAMLLDLVERNQRGNRHFERLMALGHRSDHFINLFGASEADVRNLDGIIDRAESSVRAQRPPESG